MENKDLEKVVVENNDHKDMYIKRVIDEDPNRIDMVAADILLSIENLKSRHISFQALSISYLQVANEIKEFLDCIGLRYNRLLLGYAYNQYEVNNPGVDISEIIAFLSKCSNDNKFTTDEQYKFNASVKYLIYYHQLIHNQCRFDLYKYFKSESNVIDRLMKLRDNLNSLIENHGEELKNYSEELTQMVLSSKQILKNNTENMWT